MHSAGWAWFGGILFLMLYEAAAVAFGTPTLSQWVWRTSDTHWWFKWVVLAVNAGLMWHFFGSSWWIGRN
jgi:hypothetical protein